LRVEALSFGKYSLYDKLAEGGMAVVWRAKLHGPGGFEKSLVVKQIRPELAAVSEFMDLFVAEAKVTVSLTHANIVPIYELGMVDGTYFLALEYIDGPPLREIIEQGPVSPFLAGYIVEQVLRGLDYAHRRGVVHRDLSAANVMVSRDGEVKIVDFGIAAPVDARAVRGGSRGYVAPEQEAGGRAEPRSDLYAVGVLMWELISGKRFDGTPPVASTPLQRIIQKATAHDPEERFVDAATMLQAVSRFMRDVSYAPNQMELSSLVRKRCPDIPRGSENAGGEAEDDDKPDGPRTAAIPGRKSKVGNQTGQQVTFATRIALADTPEGRAGRSAIVPVVVGAVALLAVASAGAVVLWQGRVAPPGTPPETLHAQPAPAQVPAPPPKKLGRLTVKTDPAGAEVRLGDKLLGLSPLEAQVPLDGPMSLTLKRRGYAPVERALEPGQELAVSEKLAPLAKGRLTLNALPWAHVTIDGEKAQDTPILKLPITVGPHVIKLDCPPTGKQYKLNVLVDPDEDLRRVVDLRGEPKVTE
jgi:eukaryotic-like serine/threonine-protein kinase